MFASNPRDATRPPPDRLLSEIAEYVAAADGGSDEARDIARYCLLDSLGCALLALHFPACTRLLGPLVPGEIERARGRAAGGVDAGVAAAPAAVVAAGEREEDQE